MHPPFPLASWNAAPSDLPDEFIFEKSARLECAAYRDLYHAVGDKWFWVNRKHMDDKTLKSIIHAASTEIYTLSHKGKAVGFVELNVRDFPSVEIVFVGLIDRFIGLGLGRYMLSKTLWSLAARAVRKLRIQTCTLDHVNALPLYEEFGFRAVSQRDVELRHNRFHVLNGSERVLSETAPD